jgi:hypothetical protein
MILLSIVWRCRLLRAKSYQNHKPHSFVLARAFAGRPAWPAGRSHLARASVCRAVREIGN